MNPYQSDNVEMQQMPKRWCRWLAWVCCFSTAAGTALLFFFGIWVGVGYERELPGICLEVLALFCFLFGVPATQWIDSHYIKSI